jgi:hypothetical protein
MNGLASAMRRAGTQASARPTLEADGRQEDDDATDAGANSEGAGRFGNDAPSARQPPTRPLARDCDEQWPLRRRSLRRATRSAVSTKATGIGVRLAP